MMTGPRSCPPDLAIGPVAEGGIGRILTFLSEQGYAQSVEPEDRHYAAECLSIGKVIGTGRLSAAQGTTVLRGMRVRPEWQRLGIGRRILKVIEQGLQSDACYCIPYRWLKDFYGTAGFLEVPAIQVPAFLAERHARYLARDADVILMYRPPSVLHPGPSR